jgi:hypothetical protein
MTVQKATTRKRIATVKFTEAELNLVRLALVLFIEERKALGASEAANSARTKLIEATQTFVRYT